MKHPSFDTPPPPIKKKKKEKKRNHGVMECIYCFYIFFNFTLKNNASSSRFYYFRLPKDFKS